MIRNDNIGKGSVFYGLHFYPGVAEYREEDQDPYRVFINEDTIRSMGPTFEGRPVFVEHVDEVESNINELRKEADGWVIESFYNTSDGKHWVKFVVVSDKGMNAIERGLRLSNCYFPKSFGPSGIWNGLDYEKEVIEAEYEHLAIVPNPRYEESIILSPEEFKKYNEDKLSELKKLANSNKQQKETSKMKFNFFKRSKIENSLDLENTFVALPKSKRELTIETLINEADEKEMKNEDDEEAKPHHLVNVDGEKMTVENLVEKYKTMCSNKKNEDDEDTVENEDDEEDDSMENEDDEEAMKKALELAEHEKKEIKEQKKKNAKTKADALRNAHLNYKPLEKPVISTVMSQINRGKELLGSGKF